MRRGLQGRGEAGAAVVGSQRQGEGGGCCRHWRVVGGGRPVELGAGGAAPAAAVKTEKQACDSGWSQA